MLQLRTFVGEPESQRAGTIFPAFFSKLGSDSSDSQRVDKIRNDRPKAWGIIKE
jgi:hypothetical protein